MLQVMGQVFSEKAENFNELVSALTEAGYQIAYNYPTSATIIKEVVDEPTNETT
jgi:hypothetical protein